MDSPLTCSLTCGFMSPWTHTCHWPHPSNFMSEDPFPLHIVCRRLVVFLRLCIFPYLSQFLHSSFPRASFSNYRTMCLFLKNQLKSYCKKIKLIHFKGFFKKIIINHYTNELTRFLCERRRFPTQSNKDSLMFMLNVWPGLLQGRNHNETNAI